MEKPTSDLKSWVGFFIKFIHLLYMMLVVYILKNF
jgi:hypothetical protein